MSIWRAIVRISRPNALPTEITDGSELGAVVAAMVDDKGGPWSDREEALGAVFAMEREGSVTLEGPDDSGSLAEVRDLVDRLDAHLADDPGLSNVIGDHRAWSDDPEHYDFVDTETELGLLKRFERDLYLRHLTPYLAQLPTGARLLDAGCGPGRFVSPMLERGLRVHLVDAAKDALHRALSHGLSAGGNAETLDGHVADIDRLDAFEDATFDAVLSIEVICYRGDPLAALKELTRVTKPGGLVMLSVEGLYGALMVTEGAAPSELNQALQDAKVSIARDVHVTYYTEATLKRLLVEAGLEPVHITGCHYVPEGPFHQSVDISQLEDDAYRQAIFNLEATCASDPALQPLARAWVAIGRRP